MNESRIQMEGINLNLSPDAFHRWATHYYKCKQDFRSPHKFSPVPYFLLCRAIELEIKSKHLQAKRQTEVKVEFGHNLMRAYAALAQAKKVLTDDEIVVLEGANKIYASKGFEYFVPKHTLTGYSAYPDLETLDAIASKLIDNDA